MGTPLEWYDFFLHGTAAALVFGELFFPDAEPLAGTLLAFATYAVGFVARPVGGVIAGHGRARPPALVRPRRPLRPHRLGLDSWHSCGSSPSAVARRPVGLEVRERTPVEHA